jgi:hypothetical protein
MVTFLHYQDHLTKFAVLRPLTSKLAAEVGFQLLDIFLFFGAPHILQSHNGREFTANIIKELKDMCQIVLWFMVNQDTLSHKEVLKGVTLI